MAVIRGDDLNIIAVPHRSLSSVCFGLLLFPLWIMTRIFSRRRREVVEHELQHIAAASDVPAIQHPEGGDPNETGFESQLEQADGGVVAWRNLIAAFMFEALLWGRSSPLFHPTSDPDDHPTDSPTQPRLSHLLRRLPKPLFQAAPI